MTETLMSLRSAVAHWAIKAQAATVSRDQAIVRMVAEGASLREVGQAAGLSHTAVAKIVARRSA